MEFDGLSIALAVAIAVMSLLVHLNKAEPDVHPALLEQQASVATIRKEGQSLLHRAKSIPESSPLLTQPTATIKTLHDVWKAGLAISASNTSMLYLLHNQGSYMDVPMVDRQISGFGSGLLREAGLQPKTEAPVGLFTAPSRECFIAQQALARFSLVAVPIHDLKKALPECPSLKSIIVAGIYISPEQLKAAGTHNAKLVKFAQVAYSGLENPVTPSAPEPQDVAMINFNTVWSSKELKGVVLTHANLVAAVAAFQATMPGGKRFTSRDRLISHFAVGDVLGTVLTASIISVGGSIVFPTGLMKNVLHDAQASCPTVFASTPVILEKIQEALLLSYGKGLLFGRAYAAKLAMLKQGHITPSSLWDFVGLSDIRAKLGGKIRLVVTTADPIKPGTMDFFRAGAGVPAIKIYGHTETSGVATCRNIYDYSSTEHAGPPMGCNEIKLLDNAKHGYTAADQPFARGEILVRGPNVMKGYFSSTGATSATLDSEGWFHTGDYGQLLDNGTLEMISQKEKLKN
ncbi:Long-chain-fatty-acid--CoA ligase 5 [Actinomortierella ambigua]|nr:Long-chain-fatty-acid--CoA ligase 5 [Actinomortierella ambigua]